jgi:alpha-tubulin suppressor-like RCC1 family protein
MRAHPRPLTFFTATTLTAAVLAAIGPGCASGAEPSSSSSGSSSSSSSTSPTACVDGASCDDGDPCTTGDVCSNGVCTATPVACDAPPAPTCISATTLRTSSMPGACAAATCSYPSVDALCTGGCAGGACQVVAAAVSAGFRYTCAVTSAGAAMCWGTNNMGQLGDGSATDSSVPVPVKGLSSGIAAISASYLHTCALTSAGAVTCWGANNGGELGDGKVIYSKTPVAVLGLSSGVASLTSGLDYTCALTTTGGVVCWGFNTFGQLGNGATGDSSVPVPVAGLPPGVIAVTAGENHACALTAGGAVQCWGDNNHGELGNSGTSLGSYSTAPVPVEGLSAGVVAVSAGAGFTCALTITGAVKCWGKSGLTYGSGSPLNGPTPVEVVPPSSGIVALTSGTDAFCAITAGGGAECLGSNVDGQLGDGQTVDSLVPAAVVGLSSGVVALSAGTEYACAITSTGALSCWGNNLGGALGNGTNINVSPVPVPVVGL